ncbi:Putative ribonuclease H protein At1g65750 [Linum grandiflorum]
MKLGFHHKFITWIRSCVTTVTYSINFNGRRCGFFKPSRGLRQGDPLSPLLFAICSEGLSRLLSSSVASGTLKGIKISRSAPQISHLFFADDSFLFLEINQASIRTLKDLFLQFQLFSGQKINFGKSTIFFSQNTPPDIQLRFSQDLGVHAIGVLDKYLGLPSLTPKSKKDMFKSLEDKLRKRLTGWNSANLSLAGKEVLIKSVASSFPLYAMKYFKLPTSVAKKFNRLIANFWWKSSGKDKPIHWVQWSKLTLPKDKGGLGFRDFRAMNQALLAQQGWELLTNQNTLSFKLLKGKYFPHGNFLNAKLGASPSWIWRSILFGRELLLSGLQWQLGNGQSFNFLSDPWLNNGEPVKPSLLLSLPSPPPDLKFFHSNGHWNSPLLASFFTPTSVRLFETVPIPKLKIPDSLTWSFTKNGICSVKSAYHRARQLMDRNMPKSLFFGPSIDDPLFWRSIWNLDLPPKIKTFLWRIFSKALPLGVPLSKRIPNLSPNCPVCLANDETMEHLFLHCEVAKRCFQEASAFPLPSLESESNILLFWRNISRSPGNSATLSPQFLAFLWWRIWKARNDVVFSKFQWTIPSIISKVRADLQDFLVAHRDSQTRPPPLCSRSSIAGTRWKPPPKSWIKINTDASRSSSTNLGSTAWIVRNDQGKMLFSGYSRYKGIIDVATLEALAIRDALLWASNHHLDRVILESDCLSVVQLLQIRNSAHLAFGAILKEILQISSSLNFCVFNHASRLCNRAADKIAKSALSF